MASSGCAFSFAVWAERVEALACWFDTHAWVQGGGRESPRRARYFSLLRQRKVPKRKATPSLRPLRCAKGKTCGVSVAGCAVELALRWRAPLGQPRRVRSQSTRAPTRVPPRNRPAAGAASRGGAVEHPNSPTGLCFARPSLRSAWRLRPRDGAERSNGPWGCSAVGCSAVQPPSGCACGGAVAGWHARRSARAS